MILPGINIVVEIIKIRENLMAHLFCRLVNGYTTMYPEVAKVVLCKL